MTKRLVWNFEIDFAKPFSFQHLSTQEKETLRWEMRCFWPEEATITLHGLDTSFLELSRYSIKHRQDHYYLLPNSNYNLKMRRDELLYKPLLIETPGALGFGKKIKLQKQEEDYILPEKNPISAKMLLEQIKIKGQCILVDKEALLFALPTTPIIKLELTRLTINTINYFSVCLEGHSRILVESISKHLLGSYTASNYITFLNGVQRS